MAQTTISPTRETGIEDETKSVIFYGTNIFDNRTVKSAQTAGDTAGGFPVKLALLNYAPDRAQWGLRLGYKF